MSTDIPSSLRNEPFSILEERLDGNKTASRRVTAVACLACQRRKGKCDGQRPTCSACSGRKVACNYETADGLTRGADLRQKNKYLTSRVLELERLLEKLRSPDEYEAASTYAALRRGDEIHDIVGVQSSEVELVAAHQMPLAMRQVALDLPTVDDFQSSSYANSFSGLDGQPGSFSGMYEPYARQDGYGQ